MTANEVERYLIGNVGALVTPLLPGAEQLDVDALAQLISAQEAAGSSAVAVLGTSGEGHVLAPETAAAVVDTAVKLSSVPVVCGVTGTSTRDALHACRWAQERGASAVLVTPPTYYRLGPDPVEAFFATILDGSPVPVLVDHMPGLAKSTLPPAALVRLAGHPNAVAVVDGGGDLAVTAEVAAGMPVTTPLLIARAPLLLAGLAVGARGLLSPAGGCAPAVVTTLLDAFATNDLTSALKAQRQLSALAAVLHSTPVSVSFNVKVLLAHVGVLTDAISPAPFGDLPEAQKARLIQAAADADTIHLLVAP